MKKAESHKEGEMRAQYDFSSAVKNPYAERFALGSKFVMIKPEIFAAFPSEEAVNDALERLMRAGVNTGARASRRSPQQLHKA
jgi:hypothetical protein